MKSQKQLEYEARRAQEQLEYNKAVREYDKRLAAQQKQYNERLERIRLKHPGLIELLDGFVATRRDRYDEYCETEKSRADDVVQDFLLFLMEK